MHPFDLKSVLLAKHAQHVVLVHFPIALFITGVAFDLAGRWTRNATLVTAAYWNILAAAASVIPVLATGILAWQLQLDGQKLNGVLLLHLALGCSSGLLICLVAWLQIRRRRVNGSEFPSVYLTLELMTVAVVALTGHLGGFLSGVNISSPG
jgi:uncharacterized membrane protein